MPSPGTLSHISTTAYVFGVSGQAQTERELAYAAGVEALAAYLASGCAEADDLLRRIVPDLELAED